jgi:hypothetical protein
MALVFMVFLELLWCSLVWQKDHAVNLGKERAGREAAQEGAKW